MDEILDHPLCGLSRQDQQRLKVLASDLDALGTFPEEAVDIIVRNKHFHLFVPTQRGGLDYSLVKGMRIIETYSRIEGNLGWIVQIGAGGGVFSAYLPEVVSDRFLGQPDQVIAGSDFVGGEARSDRDGYQVTGEWGYASGSLHATAFTGNVRIVDGPEEGQIRAIIVPAKEVDIVPNWKAMGMRATDSHSFRMNQVRVPRLHSFVIRQDQLLVRNKILNLPFLVYARALFMPVLTGIGYEYIQLTEHILSSRNITGDNQFEKTWNHLRETWKDCRHVLFRMAERLGEDSTSGQPFADGEDEFGQTCIRITSRLINAIDQVHRFTGMKGILMNEPVNVAYRNIKTAAAHVLLRPA